MLVAKQIKNKKSVTYCFRYALYPKGGGKWDGSLNTVTELRCDGYVELCYEWSDVDVWGKIVSGVAHFPIKTYMDEHNETNTGSSNEWKKLFYPATQCAQESTYKGKKWDTKFKMSPVVIGHFNLCHLWALQLVPLFLTLYCLFHDFNSSLYRFLKKGGGILRTRTCVPADSPKRSPDNSRRILRAHFGGRGQSRPCWRRMACHASSFRFFAFSLSL